MSNRRHETIEKGIGVIHSASCDGTLATNSCVCEQKPSYQAHFWNARSKRLMRKHFASLSSARAWREDLRAAARAGKAIAGPSRKTVGESLDHFIVNIESGAVLHRSQRPYKPATVRSYRRAVARLKPEIGGVRLTELRRRDIKALADRLRVQGLSASTISNTIDPLRAMYREALDNELVTHDPTFQLRLPSASSDAKERGSVSPATAEKLIEALPESDQALWAMAIYVGLRRGELQALRCSDLDLATGVGRCERAWDDEGRAFVSTKSKAGNRTFPLPQLVVARLRPHLMLSGRRGADLVFGRTPSDPFTPSTIRRRSRDAWKAAELEPITLHEGRHSAATIGAVAGLDDLLLSRIMGHSSITVTKDTYGHARDDHMGQVKAVLDAYLEEATGA